MSQELSQKMPAATPQASAEAIIASGKAVLATEAAALQQMEENLPKDFAAVVQLMMGVKGRVIVSGIGKSGHIGRKIAATLASTGTPSYFVHCAEASHGDLGMVTASDICLLISNSGETTELQDIVAHTRRFSIPMVAISSKADSTLMKAADYQLCLPGAPEACSIGMAPTTSTTLTLALGDALAVALMEQRGFVAEDFRVFHPGGKLGAQLATVAQLMHQDLPLVSADTAMQDCLLTMTSKGFGIAAVVEDGRLSGVISDGDLRRNMAQLMRVNAGDIASKDPITIAPDELAVSALATMNARKISVLMVVDGAGAPVGILHIHDLLRAGVA